MPTQSFNIQVFEAVDPGDAGVILVEYPSIVELTIGAGVETNTCAIPSFIGQILILSVNTVGAGTRAVTFASAINKTGNTIATFAAAGDILILMGVRVAGVLCWRVVQNDGPTLS